MGKSKAAKVQVPECRYGAACTRRDCIFKHPPKKANQPAPQKEKTDKVCFAFVAGRCAFGRQCHDKHPDEASCRTIRDRYAKIDCQWGRNCRTEGCLYQHPGDEPAGRPLPPEPPKPQPAVYAEGPRIVPQQASPDEARARAYHHVQMQIPRAIAQAADLRDASTYDVPDPLERFLAVNARNAGTQSAALLDLHFQSVQTFQLVLDEVLPERLQMFPDDGVWVLTGAGAPALSRAQLRHADSRNLFDAVQSYLQRGRYDFAIGHGADGQQGAFFVRGRRKLQDPLEGVRAVLLCGIPGSGKSMIAEALVKKSEGRFVRICQDDFNCNDAACEEAFQRALADASRIAKETRERGKAGSWWWDHAFNPDRFYLAVCFRTPAFAFLSECCGITLPRADFLHATLAYQPTTLDLRRYLGRPHRVTLRCHLVLEGTAAPHLGELFEVILCTAASLDGGSAARPMPLHITLAGPRAAARNLQVLNAISPEKRILANSQLGNFKVRHVADLNGGNERLGLCLLMYKAGDHRDTPAPISFDAPCLVGDAKASSVGAVKPGAQDWTQLGTAALASLDPLVVLEEAGGGSDRDWQQVMGERCAALGFRPPRLQVARPAGPAESRVSRCRRLRSSCLLHCAAEETVVSHLLRGGAAVLRRGGAAALPPLGDAGDARALPPVVVLDRCNLKRAERRHWLQLSGLQKSEIVALHLDVPERECISRIAHQGEHHLAKATAAADLAATIRPLAALFEPPADGEGFKAIIRLKGSIAAAQELVRRWTQDWPAERCDVQPQRPADDGEEEEAPAPPLPSLTEWIEVEEQGGRRSVWGVPIGCPVDAPLGAPFEVASPHGGTAAAASASSPGGRYEPLMLPRDVRGQEQDQRQLEAQEAWQSPDVVAEMPQAPGRAQQEEDAEEWVRQEQLATTLRCMGFDEEPSLHAALRAGGNLNVAVESVLQSSGTTR